MAIPIDPKTKENNETASPPVSVPIYYPEPEPADEKSPDYIEKGANTDGIEEL